MTTAAPSTELATIQPAFTDAERIALAVFLAGYRGLTRGIHRKGWRTSRSKVLDNAIIGYSMLNEITCIRT
jgi:hypothetical protein